MEPTDYRLDNLPPNTVFQATETAVPNLGLTAGEHWFRVKVQNQLDSQRFVLEIRYPLLDYVDFYVKRANSTDRPVLSGDLRPFDSRYRSHRTLNFALDLSQGETVELILKVETQSSVQVPLVLYTEAAFGDNAASENLGFGLFYGSLLVIILYNLLQWVMIRESIYVKYVIYLIAFMGFQMALNGSVFQLLLSNYPPLANNSLLLLNFLSWAFAFEFGSSFVNFRTVSPKLHRVVRGIALTCGFGALSSAFLPYSSLVAFVVIFAIAFPPLFVGMGILAIKDGQRSANFFTLAFAFIMFGAVLYALKTATILPSHFVTEYAMQLGTFFQVILLSLALGDRAREAFEERDQLLQEVLEKTKALNEEALKASELERQRVDAVQELRLEAETKVSLFSDATHHLNNPLNHITGSREIINGEVIQIHERLNSILPTDQDPDVIAVRKAFEKNFRTISEAEVRLDDALSRASNAVSVLRAVSGVDGLGIEPCYLAEVWALLKERIFIADDNTNLSPPADFMELRILGAPGLYVQAIEVLLEATQRVPQIMYQIRADGLEVRFNDTEIQGENLRSIVLKINHLIKVTGASAYIVDHGTPIILLPMSATESTPLCVALEDSL